MSDSSEADEKAPSRASPTPAAERIETLDVLRGLALFGILLINLSAMVMPTDWFHVAWDDIGPIDTGVEALKVLFFQGKFYTLFGFLFGVGFALQLSRAEDKGVGFVFRYIWRMLLLLAIGVFHYVVIWDGDILTTYASCGLILLLFMAVKRLFDWLYRLVTRGRKRRTPRWWVLVGACLFMFGPLALFGGFSWFTYGAKQASLAGEELTTMQQRAVDQLAEISSPKRKAERAKQDAETLLVHTEGSYPDLVQHRAKTLPRHLMPVPFWGSFIAIFLLGAYFGRRGFFARAAELRRGFKRLTIAALVFGLPLTGLFLWVCVAKAGQEMPWWQSTNYILKATSGLAIALALVGAVTLGMLGRARAWLTHLAPIGRMALTNYLLQSVIGTTLIFGYGVGLVGDIGATAQALICVVIFGVQIVGSRWWLARYRFGPVEWLWRSATYLRRQPMRRD